MKTAVVWTRAGADLGSDNAFLPSDFFSVPAITIEPVQFEYNFNPNHLFIVSSARTLDYVEKGNPNLYAGLKSQGVIYTFGPKTTLCVEALGFNVQRISSANSLKELCSAIVESKPNCTFVYLGARKSAFDIEGFFSSHQSTFYKVDVYQSIPSVQDEDLKKLKQQFDRFIICVASPSALYSMEKALLKNKIENRLYVSIGPTTSAALNQLNLNYREAKEASIEALARCADEWYKELDAEE